MLSEKALRQLGKIELHCHLDGSLSLPMVRRLAKMAAIAVPASDEALRQLVQARADAKTLMDYLRPFDFVRPLLQTKEALRLAAYDVLAQAAAENVRYIEVRFAPELSMDKGLTATDTILAVIAGLQDGMAAFDIQAQALICGMRQSRPELSATIFQAAGPFRGQGVAGADFAGNEADFPPDVLTIASEAAKKAGLPLTFHAGECHCAANVYQALSAGATRIGHGTALFDQPAMVQQLASEHVAVELCLTSNLQTKAAATYAEFPYPVLARAGVSLSINTDNRTVSNTTLTREYELFQEHFGLTAADFARINHQAADVAFLADAEKAQLQARLTEDYRSLLAD